MAAQRTENMETWTPCLSYRKNNAMCANSRRFATRNGASRPATGARLLLYDILTFPVARVNDNSCPMVKRVYSVRLGDTTLTNMTAIPSPVFNDDNVRLRIWFDDGANGVHQLSPGHLLSSSPYAIKAANADIATSATIATCDAVSRVTHGDVAVLGPGTPFALRSLALLERV